MMIHPMRRRRLMRSHISFLSQVSLCIALQLLWNLNVVIARQEFLLHPTYTEVNPGETAKLDCTILNKVGHCGWQKDRKPQGIFPKKYEWNGDYEKGDCSLLIHNASIETDDGLWECQVTASSIYEKDELSSTPVHLVVRASPQFPVLETGTLEGEESENITVNADEVAIIKCNSRFGNPAARIKWFLDDNEITQNSIQVNITELTNAKLSQAYSTLNYSFSKEHNGGTLKCVAFHEAFERKSAAIATGLNVHYLPTVSIEGSPTKDVEDGKDVIKLECHADSNPPALVSWKKNGRDLISSPIIQFNPIQKEDSGSYSCEGRNSLGTSETATTSLNVKYQPINVQVFPTDLNVSVHNQTSFKCTAEGNPLPHFTWWFREFSNPEKVKLKGIDDTLLLKNVTYKDQGNYFCMASNAIHGEERITKSEEVKVNVFGVPLILKHSDNEMQIEKGEDAILKVPFCSDPPPNVITWEWGSMKLAVGEGKGKYIAEQFRMANKQADCYEARLIVQKADPSDARYYMLTVENGRGNDTYIMALDVSEPVSMPAIIGIVIGCLILLVIIVLIILYAVRTEKWCFHNAVKFQQAHILKDGNNSKSLSRAGAIPPDALYTLPTKHYVKTDADKDIESNDLNENKNRPKEIEDEVVALSHPSTTPAPSHFQVGLSETHYRPHIHEVADI